MVNKAKQFGLFLAGILFFACGSAPAPKAATPPPASFSSDELDAAIRETSDYLNKQLHKGDKLVILNIQSEFPAFSEYIIDGLIANTVDDKVFSVVDRKQLDAIRTELDFQASGEVNDETAQSAGQMVGAQVIISGAISRIGDLYRLRIRALGVQSAEIEGQFNKNIPNNSTIEALVKSQATGYGSGSDYADSGLAQATAKPAATAQTAPAAPAVPAAQPAPVPATPPAPAVTYNIGDKGPAGGIVFLDKGYYSDEWRYLEAASSDIMGKAACSEWGEWINGTNTSVGTGKKNTQLWVDHFQGNKKTGMAAQLVSQFAQGGFTDWFLPSKEELNFMYENLKKKGLGGFKNDNYWSSSQVDSYALWSQNFSNGNQNSNNSTETCNMRAIRAF